MKEKKRKSNLLVLSALLEQNLLGALATSLISKEEKKARVLGAFLELTCLLFALKSAYLEDKKLAQDLFNYCQRGFLQRIEALRSYFENAEEETILDFRSLELLLIQGKKALEENHLLNFIDCVDQVFEHLEISSEEMEKELFETSAQAKALGAFLREKPEKSASTTVISI